MAAKRARPGSGTIYLRKDGRYEGAAYVLTTSGAARRVRVYGASRAETRGKLQGLLDRNRKAIPAPDRSWTLGAWLEHWMDTVVAGRTRRLTQRSYESTIRLHIDPQLRSKRLDQLSVHHVQQAINQLLLDGHSIRTAQKVRSVLRAALNRALREELIFRNVATLVELPAWERKPIRPWTAEQAATFLEDTRDHKWYVGYLLLLTYGMRKGEVLGLRWSDIDFEHDTIQIAQQVQRIDGHLQVGPLKTSAGRRRLPLVPSVKTALRELAAVKKIAPGQADAAQLILTTTTGQPVDPQGLLRTFYLLTAKAGLPQITIHHLRHTTATLLSGLGIGARQAQLILGHANVTTTQQIYQHEDPAAHRRAINAIEHAIARPATQSTAKPDAAGNGDVSRQTQPSSRQLGGSDSTEPPSAAGSKTEVMERIGTGTPGWARTNDMRLRSSFPVLVDALPASVVNDLHIRTKRHIVGRVAVRSSRQTVHSTIASARPLDDLATLRDACRTVLCKQLQRRSFPLNLIPTDPKEAHS